MFNFSIYYKIKQIEYRKKIMNFMKLFKNIPYKFWNTYHLTIKLIKYYEKFE